MVQGEVTEMSETNTLQVPAAADEGSPIGAEVGLIEPELQERIIPAQWMAQKLADHLLEVWEAKMQAGVPQRFRPRVSFATMTTRRCRGVAHLSEGRIVLYPDGQRIGTLVHEVAHFIAYAKHRDGRHGRAFQRVHVWLLLQVQRDPNLFLQHSVAPPEAGALRHLADALESPKETPRRLQVRATQLAFV